MISKHVGYEAAHDNYAKLAKYIADADHEGEKCLMTWCAGCAAEDDYELAVLEAQAVQALNTRSAKEKTYHLLVSFRPEDEAKLTPEAFKAIEERFAAALGFSEHQRHCGIHKNTNNIHMHVSYNMINSERYTRHEPFRDYATRDKLCRELEHEYSLSMDNGREQAREGRLSQKAAVIEAQTGQESFESYAKRHKDKFFEALEHSSSWQDFHEGLQALGLGIKPHGNGLVITDLHGEHAAKASAVDRSLSANRLQKRLSEFQAYRGLRQIEELSRYQAAPLHRAPERGELYSKYKAGIETRKSKLEAIREREDKQLAAIHQQWAAKRHEIENMSIAKRNRRNLLTVAKKHEAEALVKAKLASLPEREAVRREIPFTSWSGFLRQEAEHGNEIALAVLRSRKETVEVEQPQAQSTPAKNWMERGNEYATRLSLRADFAEKQRIVQEREDLSAKSKKQLQAILRMEQVVAETQIQGSPLGEIKHRIDGKGVIIFTLESGGNIRDAGKEVFFSIHDAKTQHVAMGYARKKWGIGVQLKGNSIVRSPKYDQEIENTRCKILER